MPKAGSNPVKVVFGVRNVRRKKGVAPVYCGENGRQNALDYAQQRMDYGRCDIHVLDDNWNVVETITNENLKPVV